MPNPAQTVLIPAQNHYIYKEWNELPPEAAAVNTIVSSAFAKETTAPLSLFAGNADPQRDNC